MINTVRLFLSYLTDGVEATPQFLYAIETTQVIRYYREYPSDRRIFKWAVALAFASDTAGSMAAAGWQYMVS